MEKSDYIIQIPPFGFPNLRIRFLSFINDPTFSFKVSQKELNPEKNPHFWYKIFVVYSLIINLIFLSLHFLLKK